jgi:ABC-type uncharacterized transport system involved in gliding motility auxiliary subunit
MRERLQEWAVYFGAVGLALWVVAGIFYLLGSQTNQVLLALLAVGLVFVALYVYLRPDDVRALVTSRGARYGSNALLLTVAFIGIIGVLNFLGARYHYRQDVTANQNFTLSPLTVQVLKDLKEPVQATFFYDPQTNVQDTLDRLKEYARQTNKFTYRQVDFFAEPLIANQLKAPGPGSIVVERGTRRENVFGSDEQSLTNAILKVSQDKQVTIYFTTGHGEHTLGDSGQNGYSVLKSGLETLNYRTDTLDLKTVTSTLPSDIGALVIAGPRQPFEPAEVKMVNDYLDKSGRVLVMLDPQTEAGLDDLLKGWNIAVQNDVVFDPKSGLSGQPQISVVSNYPNHTITSDLIGIASIFPGSRSLSTAAGAQSSRAPAALLTTSDASWGETDFASVSNQTAKFDDGKDIKGPLTLAYAVENPGDQTARLVVVGNSSFIANGILNARLSSGGQPIQSGNGQLFVNMVNWLAGQENLIQIPAKSPSSHPLFLTATENAFLAVSTVLLLPGAILIIGLLVWMRRR